MTVACARRSRRHQRGAALLTAMIIVVLVATLASAMVWQQWRAVQVEAAERARAQSAWILNGALDWARLILREDLLSSTRTGDGTRLGEPWSFPLAEARLSSFLAADKENNTNEDDGPAAFLSGSIADAQAKYNVGNLIVAGKVSATELAVLQRLFDSLGISPDVAQRIATGLRDASPPPTPEQAASGAEARPENPPLMPQRLRQLVWFGVDEASLARMEAFAILLPNVQSRVNLNTAPREVLAAVTGLDLAGAERLRLAAPFKTIDEAEAKLGGARFDAAVRGRLDVKSSYFEVRGRLRLEDRILEERSLVQRSGDQVLTLQRERVASREATP